MSAIKKNRQKLEDPPPESEDGFVPWKPYLIVTAETIAAFYIATFCLAVFFIHRADSSWVSIAIMVLLYLSVIAACAKLLFNRLSIAALMLIIPIAPLLALIMVISLIPILQHV